MTNVDRLGMKGFTAVLLTWGVVLGAEILRAEGTATVEGETLTLDGLVTNVTAEADLGSVTRVVLQNGGGIAFDMDGKLSRQYTIAGEGLAATGIVSVAAGRRVETGNRPNLASGSVGHVLVKRGPGDLWFNQGPGVVDTPTRWIVEEGVVYQSGGDFFGNHSSTTTQLTLDLREAAHYEMTGSHCPMGPLEMTGGKIVINGGATGDWGGTAFRGGVTVHACETPSLMNITGAAHLNHVYADVPFVVEQDAELTVLGTLRNGWNSSASSEVANRLLISGGGTIRLLGSNRFSGGVKVSDGMTVVVGSPTAFGTAGTLEIDGDVTLEVLPGVTLDCPTITGAGTLTKTGAGVASFTAVGDGVTIVRAEGEGVNGSAVLDGVLQLNGNVVTVDVPADTTLELTGFSSEIAVSAFKADIVKTGAGTLVLPDQNNYSQFRKLTITAGVVQIAKENNLGSDGVTATTGGLLAYMGNADVWHRITVTGEGGVFVAEDVSIVVPSNALRVANATFLKKGAGRLSFKEQSFFSNSVVGPNARLVADEGTLAFAQDAFGGHTANPSQIVEIHAGARVEATAHLPIGRVVMRGGTLATTKAPAFTETGTGAIEDPFQKWSLTLSLNQTIDVYPSDDGSPSVISAGRIYLAHGNNHTVFNVADGATLRLEGGRIDNGFDVSSNNEINSGFRKIGAGELVFDADAGFSGPILVEEGVFTLASKGRLLETTRVRTLPGATLRLAEDAVLAASVDTPDPFIATAELWLDATRLQVNSGQTVAEVPNFGTAGGSFTQFKSGTIPPPPVYTNNAINGLPALYFNGGSALTTDVYTNRAATLSVFMVAQWTSWDYNGGQGGLGHWGGGLSMSTVASTEQDNGTKYSFHTETATSVNNTYFSAPDISTTQITNPNRDVGTPYLDQCVYTGSRLFVSQYLGPDVAEVTYNQASTAGATFNIDRVAVGGRLGSSGKCQYGGSTTASGNRMYIGHIGELLVFTRALTDDEKAVVRAYLKRKWFADTTVSGPSAAVSDVGAATTIDVPSGSAALAGTWTSAGEHGGASAFAKTGAGTLNLRAAASGEGVVKVEEGTLELSGRTVSSRADVWLDAADESTVTVVEGKATAVANKGRVGGVFGQCLGRWSAQVPFPVYETDGIGGRNVLRFDTNAGLSLNSYTNICPMRRLHIYMVMQRMSYAEKEGQGKWGGPYSFVSTSADGDDQTLKFASHWEETLTNQVSVYAGNSSYTVTHPEGKLGEPYLFVQHQMSSSSIFSFEWTETETDKIKFYTKTDCAQTNEINRVLLGGRGTEHGRMQWYGNGHGSNRTWAGRIGEVIVFTHPLSVPEETALLAYLRAKWLGKGTASTTPPAFLSGKYPQPSFGGLGLALADNTALEQAGPTCALASLAVGEDVAFTRDWTGPTGFALFDVAGALSFGARPTLDVVTSPGETVKLFGGTYTDELPEWTVTGDKANTSSVALRTDGVYLSIGSGTVIFIR